MENDYKPRKSGFPYKVLNYLYVNGRSTGVTIQSKVGLDRWADMRGTMYMVRASQHLDKMLLDDVNRGLVVSYKDVDEHELTEEGIEFMQKYTKIR